MGDSVLQTVRLSRTVNDKRLVDNMSIEVQRGEILAILGPSGSGKSSFLRLLNRLDEPTEGTVLLEGQDYKTLPPHELRQRVGMVLQAPFLFPGTVADNLSFGPRQRDKHLPRYQIDELLEQAGLPGYAERDVSNLSGGEAQRVSLLRIVANEPHIMLLDEPTSALDAESVTHIETIITNLVRQGYMSCLIITHNTDQAARLADRIMVIENGKLKRIGAVEETVHAEYDVS